MTKKGYKIYVDGKLRLICQNNFILMNNIVDLKQKYGEDRVEVKEYDLKTNLTDDELQDLRNFIDNLIKR